MGLQGEMKIFRGPGGGGELDFVPPSLYFRGAAGGWGGGGSPDLQVVRLVITKLCALMFSKLISQQTEMIKINYPVTHSSPQKLDSQHVFPSLYSGLIILLSKWEHPCHPLLI